MGCPFKHQTHLGIDHEANTTSTAKYKAMIAPYFPDGKRSSGGLTDAAGLFGPKSMHWRLYREPGILLGSYRALLLQIAHPAVADGVHRYSSFKKDYLGRARRTFNQMNHLYFGDRSAALRTGIHLHRIHSNIKGTIAYAKDGISHKKLYCANDPELLLWVLATLIDTSFWAYEQACRPLSLSEKQQFYAESKRTALILGIPLEKYPADLDAFYRYVDQMLRSDVLRVDEKTQDLAKAILRPPCFPAYLARTLAAAGLPPRWQRAYGLTYTKNQRRTYAFIRIITKFLRKITPHPLGYAPSWYMAYGRVIWEEGHMNKLAGNPAKNQSVKKSLP